MPTKGLAAATQAAIDDVAGYFQRYAVVRCRCHLPAHSMAQASCVIWQQPFYTNLSCSTGVAWAHWQARF